jgi:hypothetical protein
MRIFVTKDEIMGWSGILKAIYINHNLKLPYRVFRTGLKHKPKDITLN